LNGGAYPPFYQITGGDAMKRARGNYCARKGIEEESKGKGCAGKGYRRIGAFRKKAGIISRSSTELPYVKIVAGFGQFKRQASS